MGPADALAAVAHGDHYRELRPGEFEPRRIGQGPAVQAVQGMGVEKGVEQTRAADVAHHADPLAGESHLPKGLVQGVGDALVRATRAEHRRPRRIQQAIHG